MKKVILVIMLLLLVGCSEKNEGSVVCSDTQYKVEETCVTLSSQELDIKNALEATNLIQNYRLRVAITDASFSEEVLIEVLIDDTTAEMVIEDQHTRIEYDGESCSVTETYIETGQQVDDCDESTNMFYKNLSFMWFTYNVDHYTLKTESLSMISGFESFDATLENVLVYIEEGYVSVIILEFNDMTIQYSIDMINEVDLGE